MISAAIFDMDGVLIDSEPLWQIADIEVYKKVGLHLTPRQCAETAGMDVYSAVQYWYKQFPWQNKTIEEVKTEIETTVLNLILEKGEAMKGVEYIFNFFEAKGIPIALASSSSMHLIEAVITKLNIKNRLKVYHSAQFEKQGKPHPAVFLSTAKMLNIDPENCIVFEDSINGLLAAKSAGMIAVAIPDPHFVNDTRLSVADLVLKNLNEFTEEKFGKYK